MSDGRGDQPQENSDVIFGHRKCQTKAAKLLYLENLHDKLHRPNMYDIGGTYMDDVSDFWFMYQTEQTANLYLIHIFVCNGHESSFTISMSSSNLMDVDRKNNKVYLSKYLEQFQCSTKDSLNYSYITSYSFRDVDVDEMKGRKVYIPVGIELTADMLASNSVINDIKASHDFRTLLLDPIGADFVLESLDEKFQVHKIVLAAHSKVFETMFKEDNHTLFNESGSIKLDVEGDELRNFLEFLYTGAVKDINTCNALALLQLADKYEVDSLRILCEHVLHKQISQDNALDILLWSDLYNSEGLKSAALKFIKKYPSVIQSTQFRQIKNVGLVQEVCRFIVS